MAAQTTARIGWYDMGDGSMRYWDGTQWVGLAPTVLNQAPTPTGVHPGAPATPPQPIASTTDEPEAPSPQTRPPIAPARAPSDTPQDAFDTTAPTTQKTSPGASTSTRRWRQWSPWMQFWVVILTVLTVPLLVMGGQMMFGGFFAQPITAVSSEAAELRDDVRLNRPIDLGYGNITVPVSVTNSGDTTADYRVVIYALVSDDYVDFENWITFENVAPGQTADANLLFHTSNDADMLVKDITRTEGSGGES
jgi:hypothetical protein